MALKIGDEWIAFESKQQKPFYSIMPSHTGERRKNWKLKRNKSCFSPPPQQQQQPSQMF